MTPHILRNGLIVELFYRVAQWYRRRPNCAANNERLSVNVITFQRIIISWLFKDFSPCLKLPIFDEDFLSLFPEGKAMATAYDCKFIETSVGINHNVDELLVGLLTQIRLKLENPEKSRWDTTQQARQVHQITVSFCFPPAKSRDLFRKRSYRKSKRRACSPLGGTTCLSGNPGTNPSTPVGPCVIDTNTPPTSIQNRYISRFLSMSKAPHWHFALLNSLNSPRKYRGSRTSASLKVKGLLGRVWARDSKSKSCENLHVL